jgi:hypothetical protein
VNEAELLFTGVWSDIEKEVGELLKSKKNIKEEIF